MRFAVNIDGKLYQQELAIEIVYFDFICQISCGPSLRNRDGSLCVLVNISTQDPHSTSTEYIFKFRWLNIMRRLLSHLFTLHISYFHYSLYSYSIHIIRSSNHYTAILNLINLISSHSVLMPPILLPYLEPRYWPLIAQAAVPHPHTLFQLPHAEVSFQSANNMYAMSCKGHRINWFQSVHSKGSHSPNLTTHANCEKQKIEWKEEQSRRIWLLNTPSLFMQII